jgi:DNA-binding MarR family transcriptional regulator
MEKKDIRKFRSILRSFDREITIQNSNSCCNEVKSLAQCHTLLEIESSENASIKDLVSSLSLDKSTISRTVDGLVHLGLVDRVIPESDRRTAKISLTDKGKNACNTINYTNDCYVEEIFSNFSKKELDTFLDLFQKLNKNMVTARQTFDCKNEESIQ